MPQSKIIASHFIHIIVQIFVKIAFCPKGVTIENESRTKEAFYLQDFFSSYFHEYLRNIKKIGDEFSRVVPLLPKN